MGSRVRGQTPRPAAGRGGPVTTDQRTPPDDPLSTALAFDSHFEWPLDDERRPIIPAAYRRGNVRTTVRRGVGRNSHRAGYHAVRSPLYTAKVAWYAHVGAVRIIGKTVRWWWVLEQHQLPSLDRKSTRLNSSHVQPSRMPSSA